MTMMILMMLTMVRMCTMIVKILGGEITTWTWPMRVLIKEAILRVVSILIEWPKSGLTLLI